jgi:hypothetical protein
MIAFIRTASKISVKKLIPPCIRPNPGRVAYLSSQVRFVTLKRHTHTIYTCLYIPAAIYPSISITIYINIYI